MGITQHFLSVQFFDSFKMAMGDSCMGRGSVNPMNMSVFDLGSIRAYIAEFIATMLFVFMASAVDPKTEGNRGFAGIAIGYCVAVCHFATIWVSGTSLNPARNIGPNVAQGEAFPDGWYISFFVPFLGGIVGALCYQWIFMDSYAGEDKAVEEENNDEFSAAADADADASISGSASDVSSVASSSV